MKVFATIGGELQAIEVHEAHTRNERNQPWIATLADYDDCDDPIGWGDTAEEAIEDLKAEIEWHNETA